MQRRAGPCGSKPRGALHGWEQGWDAGMGSTCGHTGAHGLGTPCIYTCIYMHTCVCVARHAYIHVRVWHIMHVHVRGTSCAYVCGTAYIYVCVARHACVHVCVARHACVHVCVACMYRASPCPPVYRTCVSYMCIGPALGRPTATLPPPAPLCVVTVSRSLGWSG